MKTIRHQPPKNEATHVIPATHAKYTIQCRTLCLYTIHLRRRTRSRPISYYFPPEKGQQRYVARSALKADEPYVVTALFFFFLIFSHTNTNTQHNTQHTTQHGRARAPRAMPRAMGPQLQTQLKAQDAEQPEAAATASCASVALAPLPALAYLQSVPAICARPEECSNLR